MWTRGGLEVRLPGDWRAGLPAGCSLDGELWVGRGPENGPAERAAVAAAVHGRFTEQCRFVVFDSPAVLASWPERLAVAASLLAAVPFAMPVGFTTVRGIAHLEELFAAVQAGGGEGLMLRSPAAPAYYEASRTATLLKVKIDPALARGRVRVAA